MPLVHLQEVVEQRPVIDDRLPQLLGRCLATVAADHQGSRRTVVLDHMRVIDRYVFGAPLELVEGIPARAHHLIHEAIGFADSTVGIVDEERLHAPPFAGERVGLLPAQRPQLETIHACRPLAQVGFCFGW
jgi:hypothetical protein